MNKVVKQEDAIFKYEAYCRGCGFRAYYDYADRGDYDCWHEAQTATHKHAIETKHEIEVEITKLIRIKAQKE